MNSQSIGTNRGRKGIATLKVFAENPGGIIVQGDNFAFVEPESLVMRQRSDDAFGHEVEEMLYDPQVREMAKKFGMAVVRKHNAYVNTGLNNSLDREFGIGGTAVGYIGVSSNTTAVTASTVYLNGASGGAAANTIIKAISPAASRSSQTVTGGATFANADFTSGVFVWNKIGLLTTSTDAGTGLVDVIGGTGGSAPYDRTFSLDLTSAGTFTVVAQIAVTAVAV